MKNIATSFEKALPNTGWGMTETNAIGCGIAGEDYLNHPASSGRCSAVLDIKVIDDEGKALPAGERGELLIRGASIIEGYWQRPDANAETFVDEWLRTGDVAYIDGEGYLYIVDQIKDLVIRGGENIGCAEVEAGLLAHPEILEASVYAILMIVWARRSVRRFIPIVISTKAIWRAFWLSTLPSSRFPGT